MSDLKIKWIKYICDAKTLTKEQIRKYKKYGKEFINDLTGIYIHEDLALSIIMSCRAPIATELVTKLEFN